MKSKYYISDWLIYMSLHFYFFILLTLFLGTAISKANAQTMIGIIYFYPSLFYQDHHGSPKGDVVSTLEETLKKLNIGYQIQISSWTKAYEMAKNNKSYFIFPVAKTQNREKHFKFSIPLFKSSTYLYARKNCRLKIKNLSDAINKSVCVTKNDYKEEFLIKKNFRHIVKVDNPELLIEALDSRKCDLAISSLPIESYWARKGKITQIAKKVFEVKSLKRNRYVAFNKRVSDETVKKFNIALKQVLKNTSLDI